MEFLFYLSPISLGHFDSYSVIYSPAPNIIYLCLILFCIYFLFIPDSFCIYFWIITSLIILSLTFKPFSSLLHPASFTTMKVHLDFCSFQILVAYSLFHLLVSTYLPFANAIKPYRE